MRRLPYLLLLGLAVVAVASFLDFRAGDDATFTAVAMAATRDDTCTGTTPDTISLGAAKSEFMVQSVEGAIKWAVYTKPSTTLVLAYPDTLYGVTWDRSYFYVADGAWEFQRFNPPYPTWIVITPVDAGAIYRVDAR